MTRGAGLINLRKNHFITIRSTPRAEGTLLLGVSGFSGFQIRRNGMIGGGLFRVSSCEWGYENMAFPLGGLSLKVSLVPTVPHKIIVNAIDDNVPFILCFGGSTCGR